MTDMLLDDKMIKEAYDAKYRYIEVELQMDELDLTAAESKAAY